MSNYQFIASEVEMPEYDNLNVVPIFEGKEVLALRFNSLSHEEKAMRIIAEDDMFYARQYTTKKYINYIEWRYNDINAEIVIEYLKKILKDVHSVSLFNTWNGDISPLKSSKIHINNLSIKDIKEIWGKNEFVNNECLVVYRNY